MNEKIIAISTIDNPFDPIEEFKKWYNFDTQKGYFTCALLARLANTSIDLSPKDYEIERENAINSIIQMNPILYKKIVKIA